MMDQMIEQAISQTLSIESNGDIRFVWDDSLESLRDEGRTKIERASHVEPTPDGRWIADMSPVGGPVLGSFSTRGQALDAEREWLREHLGL